MAGNKWIQAEFESSDVQSIEYLPERGILRVAFVAGTVYEYEQIPEVDVIGFLLSSSKGKYFNYLIRKLNVPFKRLHP